MFGNELVNLFLHSFWPWLLLAAVGAAAAFAGIRLLRRKAMPKPRPAPEPAFTKRRMKAGPTVYPTSSPADRRTSPRREGGIVEILVSDDSAQVPAVRGRLVDRSKGGMALELIVEGEVDPGTVLSVRTADMPLNMPWVQVVVRNRRSADVGWQLGCEYVKMPDSFAQGFFK